MEKQVEVSLVVEDGVLIMNDNNPLFSANFIRSYSYSTLREDLQKGKYQLGTLQVITQL